MLERIQWFFISAKLYVHLDYTNACRVSYYVCTIFLENNIDLCVWDIVSTQLNKDDSIIFFNTSGRVAI